MSSLSTPATRILLVDDDHAQRSLLETFLHAHGYATQSAASGEAALQLLRESGYAMIISDVRMPGMTGLETLRRVRQTHPDLPVLLVTAFADIRSAVTAMRDGAVNYLAKPIDLDELLVTIRRATHAPAAPVAPVADAPAATLPASVVAQSPLMAAVIRDVAAIAPSDSRVLITGESGVGKEIVADLIHAWSRRSAGPLVKLNCAATPENLVESELFGHEKNAFPGATHARRGRLEEAAGGTLVLDEVGELPPPLQAKLVRVFNDGTFRRLGGTHDLRADARVLATTTRDLEARITEGKFREDLFYRLNVMEVPIPPLRERPEDVLPLATHFAGQFTRRQTRFSTSVVTALNRYRWPGNVRELRNAMERAALLSHGEIVLPEHLPAKIAGAATVGAPGESLRLEEIEREAILRTLRKNNFNRTETAKELAISRRALTYKLQHLREQGVPVDPPAPD
jgi:DNA-binding NtrC family response regulator